MGPADGDPEKGYGGTARKGAGTEKGRGAGSHASPSSGGKVTPSLTLSWDISLEVKATKKEQQATGMANKTILRDITGWASSGQMVAVMGSSGAGKSSFLDCVSMRNQDFKGKVFVNAKPVDESYFVMTGELRVVPGVDNGGAVGT